MPASVRGILREQREIDERDLLEARGRIEADPALVGRIEVIDRSAGGEQLVALRALMRDQRARPGRRRRDVEHLRAIARRAARCG